MSLPIFSSLKRTASTQKAKIELDKALLNLKETENTLNLEVEKAKSDLYPEKNEAFKNVYSNEI